MLEIYANAAELQNSVDRLGKLQGKAGFEKLKCTKVEGGAVRKSLAPKSGRLGSLLRPAAAVVEDPRIAKAREENLSNYDRA